MRVVLYIQTEGRDREKYWGMGKRRREHATECPKPLEQGIFLVDWAIHSRHVTLNFFHYKTLLPSPLQRQIACTYFTQWNIASPLKQSFSSQSCEKKFETVISLRSQCTGYSLGFSYFCRLHKLILYDSACSFQIGALNTPTCYNVCTSSSSILMCPYSLSHGPCIRHSILGVIDVILGIAETTRINLLLSAYRGLWCWSQSFTLNLCGDTWCKEEHRVFWLSQLYDLLSSAASCA